LKENSTYDYVYLLNPEKVRILMASWITKTYE
jgi:hypothetical protein